MDERIFNYQPNLDGREPLDPKTIEDGTPVLAIPYTSDPAFDCRYVLCVFRNSKEDTHYDCHFTYFRLKQGEFCTFRDQTLPPEINSSYRFSDRHTRATGCDISGIGLIYRHKLYAMTDEEIVLLGSILNSFHLMWDMDTRQLIDCDTHAVLSEAELPPQPKPKYNPLITRDALLAMSNPPLDWVIEQDIYLFLFADNDPSNKYYLCFTFGKDDNAALSVGVYNEGVSIDIDEPDRITWTNLLLAIGICFHDYKQGSPIDNFVRQFPIQLTITETQKQ